MAGLAGGAVQRVAVLFVGRDGVFERRCRTRRTRLRIVNVREVRRDRVNVRVRQRGQILMTTSDIGPTAVPW